MSDKIKITEDLVEVNGKIYLPADKIQQLSPNYLSDVRIVILQRGWVYIGRFSKDVTGLCKLHNAYNSHNTYGDGSGYGSGSGSGYGW